MSNSVFKQLRIAVCFAACLLLPTGAMATGACTKEKPSAKGGEVQLFIENDMLAHSDRYYTNGLKLGIGVPGDTLSNVLCDVADLVFPPLVSRQDRHFGWFLGQNLYTPKLITVAAPQPFDRPWAAWLYLGGVVQHADNNNLNTIEVDVGMVGPAALGEQVQTTWHRWIGASKPQGWGNQIPNEPAFLVSYVHKQKFKSDYFEAIPHVGGTVGNVFTLARAGGIVRAGINMTGFGPDSIEPGGAMLQSTHKANDPHQPDKLEIYGFAGVDARLVARNIFLDGTLFRDSPSVTRRDYVHDFTVGASMKYQWLRISFTRIIRSEEFYTAKGGGGKQTFDSVNLGLEF